MLGSALVAGCGADSIPACADVDWVGSNDHAQLTGPPSFSPSEIAPGDPVTMAVPVDENTRSIFVRIFSMDATAVANAGGETEGGETVEIPVDNTNLPPGVYAAGSIGLHGEVVGPQLGIYLTFEFDMPYVLSIASGPESVMSCLTDISAPTFTVVSE